jgi:hypothetical protein
MFDEDWEPAGPMVRQQLLEARLVEEQDGGLVLTETGRGMS